MVTRVPTSSTVFLGASIPWSTTAIQDIATRVIAEGLRVKLTIISKIMTRNPVYIMADTLAIEALQKMVQDGRVAACLDVLQLTHAAISMVEGGPGTANDVANTIMLKFWDSALSLEPADEEFDSHSEISLVVPSEVGDGRSSIYPPVIGNSFAFKLQDQKGRMHRFTCGSESLDELVSSVMQRLGIGGKKGTVQLLALRLHIDESGPNSEVTEQSLELTSFQRSQLTPLHYGLMAGAIVLTGVAVMVFLKRSKV